MAAFLVGENGFGGAEFDHDVAALGATDGASDDVANLVLILLEDLVLLDLAEALVEQLLGGLGGDATEVGHVDGLADFLSDLDAGLDERGSDRVDFLERVRHGVGHAEDDEGVELARDGISVDLHVLAGHDRLLDGGLDRLDDQGAGLFFFDVLLLFEILEEGFDIDAHGDGCGFSVK